MAYISGKELLARGYTKEDIFEARQMQKAQIKAGQKIQSVAVLVGASRPKTGPQNKPVNFTDHAMKKKRGFYDQAGLALKQQALNETDLGRATKVRKAAAIMEELSDTKQLEFDFFGGGNVSVAHQYHDAITERLKVSNTTPTRQMQAKAVLFDIVRHLTWQSYECSKTAIELSDISGITPYNMSPILKLLEEVGAIKRVKRGRTKVITVTPEGAYRGNINDHAKTVEKYKLDVIEGGKA